MTNSKITPRVGLAVVASMCVAVLVGFFIERDKPSPRNYSEVASTSKQSGVDRLERDYRKLSRSGIYLAANGGTISKKAPVKLVNPTTANVDFIRSHYRVRVSGRPAKALAGACPEVLVLPNDSQETTPNVLGLSVGNAIGAVKDGGLLASMDGCHGLPTGSPIPKPWHIDALTRIVQQCPSPGTAVAGRSFVDIVGEVRLPGGFTYRTQPLKDDAGCATR